jgi:hypothetical protein
MADTPPTQEYMSYPKENIRRIMSKFPRFLLQAPVLRGNSPNIPNSPDFQRDFLALSRIGLVATIYLWLMGTILDGHFT